MIIKGIKNTVSIQLDLDTNILNFEDDDDNHISNSSSRTQYIFDSVTSEYFRTTPNDWCRY